MEEDSPEAGEAPAPAPDGLPPPPAPTAPEPLPPAPAAAPSTSQARPSSSSAPRGLVVRQPGMPPQPEWQNLDGFPQSTVTLEQRKLNPFCDINSFVGGTRILDAKGQLGARPVQQWKEMLRGGDTDGDGKADVPWRVPEYTPWQASMGATRPPPPKLPPSPLVSRQRVRSAPPRRRPEGGVAAATSADGTGELDSRALPTPGALPAPGATAPASDSGSPPKKKDDPFSFWGSREGKREQQQQVGGRSGSASGSHASGALVLHSPGQRGLLLHEKKQSHAQWLAMRRKNPPRYGPEGERRMQISERPAWRGVDQRTQPTRLTQHRHLNPFTDINSFVGGTRILDAKGQLGARPVQQWKEMLRR